jgi:hypothetical protein
MAYAAHVARQRGLATRFPIHCVRHQLFSLNSQLSTIN